MPSKKAAQLQHPREIVEKQQAAVVRQTHMDKGGFDISRRSVYADFNLTESDVKVTSHNRNESPINSACDSHSVWPFTPDIGRTDGGRRGSAGLLQRSTAVQARWSPIG